MAGYHHPGQAEFFQELTGASEFTTFLLHGSERVGLLTTHLALAEACQRVNQERIERYLHFIHGQRAGLGLAHIRIGVPAQDIFRQHRRGRFDAVLAMYHDQAAIGMDINNTTTLTLGLPILRTSVGHGTAFDIAGRGVAATAPLGSALQVTATLACHRRRQLAG